MGIAWLTTTATQEESEGLLLSETHPSKQSRVGYVMKQVLLLWGGQGPSLQSLIRIRTAPASC